MVGQIEVVPAEVKALAHRVFGSSEQAELWLSRPALALDRQRPIDLLGTPEGLEIVETLLHRLESGVYV